MCEEHCTLHFQFKAAIFSVCVTFSVFIIYHSSNYKGTNSNSSVTKIGILRDSVQYWCSSLSVVMTVHVIHLREFHCLFWNVTNYYEQPHVLHLSIWRPQISQSCVLNLYMILLTSRFFFLQCV